MRVLFILIALLVPFQIMSQEMTENNLPYFEIPEAPEDYSGANVIARMIDGLGFRFYWATEGLTDANILFRPNEEARSIDETVDHIYSLTNLVLITVKSDLESDNADEILSFEQKRRNILYRLKEASDILRNGVDLAELNIVFVGQTSPSDYPIWNLINGPIEDAIWHCGQIVSFRRSAGNPFNSKASVFKGKLRE
jgi:hypothetical protein